MLALKNFKVVGKNQDGKSKVKILYKNEDVLFDTLLTLTPNEIEEENCVLLYQKQIAVTIGATIPQTEYDRKIAQGLKLFFLKRKNQEDISVEESTELDFEAVEWLPKDTKVSELGIIQGQIVLLQQEAYEEPQEE